MGGDDGGEQIVQVGEEAAEGVAGDAERQSEVGEGDGVGAVSRQEGGGGGEERFAPVHLMRGEGVARRGAFFGGGFEDAGRGLHGMESRKIVVAFKGRVGKKMVPRTCPWWGSRGQSPLAFVGAGWWRRVAVSLYLTTEIQ
jgi:hypothetical protein